MMLHKGTITKYHFLIFFADISRLSDVTQHTYPHESYANILQAINNVRIPSSLSLCAAIFACCTIGEQIYLSISIHILTYFYPHCIYSLLLALCSMFPLKLTISLYPILLSYTFVYPNQDNIICYI